MIRGRPVSCVGRARLPDPFARGAEWALVGGPRWQLPGSCSRPASRTATRRSRTAALASTRWRSAATTSIGGGISNSCRNSTSGTCAMDRRSTASGLATGRYDWSFADETFGVLKTLDIVPIVDLCHFGVPDWIGNFQNPDFPALFAEYASAFAQRFPWVQLYTPVNEMFVCATFSAAYGWWNEQLCQRHGLRDGAQAHRQSQCSGHGGNSRDPPGCDLHPERVVGILPCRRARRDRERRNPERAPVPVARSQLWPPRRFRDVSSS